MEFYDTVFNGPQFCDFIILIVSMQLKIIRRKVEQHYLCDTGENRWCLDYRWIDIRNVILLNFEVVILILMKGI